MRYKYCYWFGDSISIRLVKLCSTAFEYFPFPRLSSIKMYKVIFATLLLVGFAAAGDVIFTACAVEPDEPHAVIHKFSVSDCADGSTECTFIRGHNYTFNVEIELTGRDSAGDNGFVPFKVNAVVLGVPITIAEGNACETIKCPVMKGQKVIFELVKEITDSLPQLNGVTVAARVWALDEAGNNGNAAACASIKISIKDALHLH